MPTHEDAISRESPASRTEAEGSRPTPLPEKQGDFPAPEPVAANENHPSPVWEPNQTQARPERERRPETAPLERAEPHADIPGGKIIPHTAPEAPVKAESSPEHTDATQAKSLRTQDAMEIQAKPEAAKGTPVRDMKFEVISSDQRVEVRLSERGGEMKMTVRTPDNNLASTLRENLPTLSTRLAESGFKSETGQPAPSSTGEWQHTAESSKGGAFQDSNPPPREQNRESHDGSGQQHPERPQEPLQQQQKGRDFAWLMSSLR
jgi:hypothetical protein